MTDCNSIIGNDKNIRIIRDEFDKQLPAGYKYFLFGSRAEGKFRNNSDYDIGILGDKELELSNLLRLKGAFDDVPILIDIVDFNTVSEIFKNIALKNTIPLN